MEKSGVVIAVNGSNAVVEVRRTSSCGDNCSSCSGACEVPVAKITVPNDKGASVGDFVILTVSESDMLKASFALYTVPLLALVLGIGLGMVLANRLGLPSADMVGLGLGFVFMILAFIAINASKKIKKELVRIKTVLAQDNLL